MTRFKIKNMKAEEILKTKKKFAIVGASDNPERYGYELVHAMSRAGYTVFPVNPKYSEILGIQCYPSLKDLPDKPEVVLAAMAPGNLNKVIESVAEIGSPMLWLPPDCWSEEVLSKCRSLNVETIHDVCPIFLIKSLKGN
jgi:predicted CoA-binding protein